MKKIGFLIFLVLSSGSILGQEISSFKTSDGESLSYTTIGHGSIIIFLSGGPGYGASALKPWADTLSNNFECILFEQRGIGLSGKVKLDSTTINLQRAVLDLDDLRKHLGKEQISLCGLSWGGGLAQAYASFFPSNVKNLVLVSPMGPDLTFLQIMVDNRNMRTFPNEKDSLKLWNNQPSNNSLEFKKAIYSQLPYFYDHTLGYKLFVKELPNVTANMTVGELMWKDLYKTYDLKSKLRNYKGECTVIKGRQDVIPEEVAFKIRELVPQTKIKFIERSGHYPSWEQPKEFYLDLKKAFNEN